MAVLENLQYYGANDLLLFMNPSLIAALFPALDVLMKEAGVTKLFEFGGDDSVGEAVVEHGVYDGADGLWELGNFALGTVGRFYMRQRRERRLRRAAGGHRIDGFLDCWMIGWVDRGTGVDRGLSLSFEDTIMILILSILSIH